MNVKKLLPALLVAIVVPATSFWAASRSSNTLDAFAARSDSRPAMLEAIPGSSALKVVLSGLAAERLGIETTAVRIQELTASASGERQTVIPYSAVLYDVRGDTWVYTSPEPLVFVRQRVSIHQVDGDNAVLSDGPAPGTIVVTVGGAQLFGAELFGADF